MDMSNVGQQMDKTTCFLRLEVVVRLHCFNPITLIKRMRRDV